ncbi:MAG: RNA polymerase sigma factor [Bacteroidales bacterium]
MPTSGFSDRLLALQDNLKSFAYTLTANRDDAEDLLQDTTLKALDNQDKYYENVNFKGWVFTIMRNIFINNYRRIVRNQTMVDQTEDLYHLNLPQDSGFETPDGSYTVNEIMVAINKFAPEYKIPFSMHIAGFKYQEIADKMGLPLGTVKSRIFFARQRLQEYLKDYDLNQD